MDDSHYANYASQPVPGVSRRPFCLHQTLAKQIDEQGAVYALADLNPVSEGHVLIITKRHVADFFATTSEEQRDALVLLARLREACCR